MEPYDADVMGAAFKGDGSNRTAGTVNLRQHRILLLVNKAGSSNLDHVRIFGCPPSPQKTSATGERQYFNPFFEIRPSSSQLLGSHYIR